MKEKISVVINGKEVYTSSGVVPGSPVILLNGNTIFISFEEKYQYLPIFGMKDKRDLLLAILKARPGLTWTELNRLYYNEWSQDKDKELRSNYEIRGTLSMSPFKTLVKRGQIQKRGKLYYAV